MKRLFGRLRLTSLRSKPSKLIRSLSCQAVWLLKGSLTYNRD